MPTKDQVADKAPATKKTPTVKPVERVSLDDFCGRLSESERRYALIAGFHSAEKRAGRHHDTRSAYAARFADFIKKPA